METSVFSPTCKELESHHHHSHNNNNKNAEQMEIQKFLDSQRLDVIG